MQARKIFTIVEETFFEGNYDADVPLRKVAAVAVVKNPFAGKQQKDLGELHDLSKPVGEKIAGLARAALAPYEVQSYGKGAIIGLDGEQEHGVAMLTTVYGNVLREAVGGGKAWISSITKRAAPGAVIDIPLAHKDALFVRSHYDGMTIMLPDAPLADEIAVICVFTNRGRLNERSGGPGIGDIIGEDGLR